MDYDDSYSNYYRDEEDNYEPDNSHSGYYYSEDDTYEPCQPEIPLDPEIEEAVEKLSKKAADGCERNPFLYEIEKRWGRMKEGNLKTKYREFLDQQEERYQNWYDCIFTDAYSANDYYYHIFPNNRLFDYDGVYNKCKDDYLAEESDDGDYVDDDKVEIKVLENYLSKYKAIFANPDVMEKCDDDTCFLDIDSQKHSTVCFRYISIEDWKELDERLLIEYANYFIERYGFLQWFFQLNDSQFLFLKFEADKLNLTKNQKDLISDKIEKRIKKDGASPELLKRILVLEDVNNIVNLEDKRVCLGLYSRLQTILNGFFSKYFKQDDFKNLDVFKLDRDTFSYFARNPKYEELLKPIENMCHIRKQVEYVLDTKESIMGNYDMDSIWDFDKIEKIAKNLDPEHKKIEQRIRVLRELKKAGHNRDLVSFILEGKNFDNDKIANYHIPDAPLEFDEAKKIAKKLNPEHEEIERRLKIVQDFVNFKEWFYGKHLDCYRKSKNVLSGVKWTLEDAYKAVHNLGNPKIKVYVGGDNGIIDIS